MQTIQIRTNNIEVLLNNFVEKDMQDILRPLNVIPIMFISAKYQICHNFITSNTPFYNICTCLASVLCIFFYFFRVYQFPPNYYEDVFYIILYWNSIIDFIIYFFGFIVNMCTNIYYSKINVFLVLKLQRAYKLLNINKNKMKEIMFYNWACITSLVTFHILWMILIYSVIPIQISFQDLIMYIVLICFDFHVLYASRLLHLVKNALKVLVKTIISSGRSEGTVGESFWFTIFEVYDEILQAYHIIEKTFEGQIICYTIITFERALFNVLILVYLKELVIGFPLYLSLNLIGLCKDVVIQIYLSKKCENVYLIMEDLKSVCLLRMNERETSITQRRICKNIQRLQSVSFKKLNVGGVYVVDAAALLKLLYLLSSYIIIILQFALL